MAGGKLLVYIGNSYITLKFKGKLPIGKIFFLLLKNDLKYEYVEQVQTYELLFIKQVETLLEYEGIKKHHLIIHIYTKSYNEKQIHHLPINDDGHRSSQI